MRLPSLVLILLFVLVIMLAGCSTLFPARQEFPAAPQVLMERCPDLMTIDDGKNTLRDMLKIVIQNYALYYQCAEKTQGWQEWYNNQKKIYENIK